MIRRRVSSSNVYAVGYAGQTLEVQFHARGCARAAAADQAGAPCVCGGGAVYEYADVPAEVYRGLLEAASVGRYVQREVVRKFTGRRVDAGREAP